ncbi:MAG: RIP metalloprotease RseP [Proteobacteria bacterium]|nr:RIP metalloprotease RseP [Pseudomonadota bacterium]
MNTSPDFLARAAEFSQSIPGGEAAFTAVLFILVLSILIFVHEWGHYLAARSVGIRVDVFSIGFGRKLFGWTDKNNTLWKVGWLPFGGYVQMFGQEDLQATRKSKQVGHFMSKSVWQRAWVIIAGPLANLVFGFLLLVAIMLTGEHRLKPEVGEVLPDMPAVNILQSNDLVQAINGTPVEDWDALLNVVSDSAGQKLTFTILRNNTPQNVEITPETKSFTDLLGDSHTVGRIGIAPSYNTFVTTHPPLQAVGRAAARTWQLTSLTVLSLYKLAIGAIPADNLTGPLGIANLTGQTAASGLFALMMFMTVITINLCIVNLFPLPILDGGHLVFLTYEKIRGQPLGAGAQEWLYRIGLACIVCLALFATTNDIRRMGLFSHTPEEESATPTGTP